MDNVPKVYRAKCFANKLIDMMDAKKIVDFEECKDMLSYMVETLDKCQRYMIGNTLPVEKQRRKSFDGMGAWRQYNKPIELPLPSPSSGKPIEIGSSSIRNGKPIELPLPNFGKPIELPLPSPNSGKPIELLRSVLSSGKHIKKPTIRDDRIIEPANSGKPIELPEFGDGEPISSNNEALSKTMVIENHSTVENSRMVNRAYSTLTPVHKLPPQRSVKRPTLRSISEISIDIGGSNLQSVDPYNSQVDMEMDVINSLNLTLPTEDNDFRNVVVDGIRKLWPVFLNYIYRRYDDGRVAIPSFDILNELCKAKIFSKGVLDTDYKTLCKALKDIPFVERKRVTVNDKTKRCYIFNPSFFL
jgi:hypothetical protein